VGVGRDKTPGGTGSLDSIDAGLVRLRIDIYYATAFLQTARVGYGWRWRHVQ
jgi:hypothetical protein